MDYFDVEFDGWEERAVIKELEEQLRRKDARILELEKKVAAMTACCQFAAQMIDQFRSQL